MADKPISRWLMKSTRIGPETSTECNKLSRRSVVGFKGIFEGNKAEDGGGWTIHVFLWSKVFPNFTSEV